MRDLLVLQLVVLLAAVTGVLGRLITLPADSLVAWRTAIAAVVIGGLVALKRPSLLRLTRGDQLAFCLGGVVLGLHWLTFFGAIKLSNVTVALAGFSAITFFTALIEPLVTGRRHQLAEILIGLLVVAGLGVVFRFGTEFGAGLLMGLVSGLLAAVFPSMNKRFVDRGAAPSAITFYELIGACVTCLIATSFTGGLLVPSLSDLGWLMILALFCTVLAFWLHVNLLRRMSAYTTALALGFEPVYGMILAAVIFSEHEQIDTGFYLGTALIVIANFVNPLVRKRQVLELATD